MIRTFRDKDTEAVFEGKSPRRWKSIEAAATRRLAALDAAGDLSDLGGVPGNRLKKLGGDREGQWSIRINDQWRLCFRWEVEGAHDVEIVDYH